MGIRPIDMSDVYPHVPARPAKGKCGLYIIECASGDSGQPICKIGITSDPEKRLYQIANTSPFKVEYSYFKTLDDRAAALATESKLHALFAEDRMNGEWFSISPKAAVFALTSILESTQ